MSGFSYRTPRGGPIDVSLTGPNTVYGEVLTAELTPVVQADFFYRINTKIVTPLAYASGTVTQVSGFAVVATGIHESGSADLEGRRKLKYRAGQGSLGRMSAIFDDPVENNYQLVGLGNLESGYFFGYQGQDFGILHRAESSREIRKLDITTAAGTEVAVITLNGETVNVPVTGGNSITQTAYQISAYDYKNVGVGWLADAVSGSVYFISSRSNPRDVGAYAITSSGAGTVTGSFTRIQVGNSGSVNFISQSSWSIDKMDGTGPSRQVLDHQKGNVYQIGFQYLGVGDAQFAIEDSLTGKFQAVHTINNANTRTTTVLKNAQVSPRILTYNVGNTSSVEVKCASFAGFTEGEIRNLDPKFFYSRNYARNSTLYGPLFALKMDRVTNGLSSYSEFDILRMAVSSDGNNASCTVGIFIDPKINGAVNFVPFSGPNSNMSVAALDPAVNTITTGSTIVPTYALTAGGNSGIQEIIDAQDLVFGAGQVIVFAVKTSGNTSGIVGVQWFEQQ